MYYVPNPYSYPYYANVNTHMHHADYMSGYLQNHQHEYEAILQGIKREACAIELYARLADAAPNANHRDNILQALEDKKTQYTQLTNLYMTLTGSQPMVQVDRVTFHDYKEGLTKAFEAGVEGYEQYRKNGLQTQYPIVQHVFFHASSSEKENAERFRFLKALRDYGSKPFVVNIEEVTKRNTTFRTALWTGEHLQVTLMSINVGDDIGLEVHPNTDQFIRVEEGQGLVRMGDSQDNLDYEQRVSDDFAIMIPAGKWHNVINTGDTPLKVYAIYAPPEHPFGTVHVTKEDAMAAEEAHT